MKANSAIFRHLDGLRTLHIERARYSASLTIPSMLPPEGYRGTQGDNLPRPFSSVPARGVISMAARLLSVMMPLTDSPFFRFRIRSGEEPSTEVQKLLKDTELQVYNKLLNSNLRDVLFETLQHLLINADVLMIMDDEYTFRNVRLDHFVVRRDPIGNPVEIMWLEYAEIKQDLSKPPPDPISTSEFDQEGFETIYVRTIRDPETGKWAMSRQNYKGEKVEEDAEFEVPPFDVIGWTHVTHEDYSRSYVEENIGDIDALESYTELLQQGLAASAAFWMGLNPHGPTQLKDVVNRPIGSWVGVRPGDVHTVSPGDTLRPQVQAAQAAVEMMRQEVGRIFMMAAASIPSGDRVTATAVRMIGLELENVTGGSFGTVTQRVFDFIIKRTLHQMMRDEEIDKRLREHFFSPEGTLSIDILTGLEALSSDTRLNSLIQTAEIVRTLPEKAQAKFNWDEWLRQVLIHEGQNAEKFIISDDDIAAEQATRAAQETVVNTAAAVAPTVAQQALQGS